uniref:Uncharacterized protein n=1 Tax=Aegilops tauschii TaxID=37682 RepID=M8BGG9_AEGTA
MAKSTWALICHLHAIAGPSLTLIYPLFLRDAAVVGAEAAIRGVAGAAAVQGRVLHLREVRPGADQEARGDAARAPRPRPWLSMACTEEQTGQENVCLSADDEP